MSPNIIDFSRNKWTTAMSCVIGNGGDFAGGGLKGDKQWLQGKHHLGLSIFWTLIPAGKNHQSQQERRGNLGPPAVWPDPPGPCPAPRRFPGTRASRAAARPSLCSGLGSRASQDHACQSRATAVEVYLDCRQVDTPVPDEMCLWESRQQNFMISYNILIT